MGRMNPDRFDFFRTHYCWGRVALVGESDWIGEALRAGQRGLTRDGHPSRWSHTFILGELRPGRRGPQGTKGCGLELIHELAALLGEHLPKGRFRFGPDPGEGGWEANELRSLLLLLVRRRGMRLT